VYVTYLSGSASPEFYLDGMNLCSGANKESQFDGGTASTVEIPLQLKQSQLCDIA
jgi:hypothetical protein